MRSEKMGRLASESIFSGKQQVVPMTDVSHIDRDGRPEYAGAITVVMKHSRWVNEHMNWEPSVWLDATEGPKFLRAWCDYRSEIDPIQSGPFPSQPEGPKGDGV